MRKFMLLMVLIPILGLSIELKLSLSYESLTLEATPASGLSFLGPEIDLFTGSGKDVSMGLGLGAKYVMSSTDTSFGTYTLELFSSATYRGKLSKSMWIEIHSKGGASIPELSFDRTGFFAEVCAIFYMKFSGWDFGIGFGVKSYSFEGYSATYVPVKIYVGKVF